MSTMQLPSAPVTMTKEQFQSALPRQIRGGVSDELMDNINQLLSDPELADIYKENILSFSNVMRDGKYKLVDYLNAVRYVSYKMFGDQNITAYSKVFPERIERFQKEGFDAKKISAYVAAYNKTQLVNKIYEMSLIPTHILNAHHFQQAINVQVQIMTNEDVSYKVRSDAANSLMTHLKRPEAQKIELDVTHKEDEATKDLRAAIRDLANKQREMIISGDMNAKEIAHSNIIEAKVEDHDDA